MDVMDFTIGHHRGQLLRKNFLASTASIPPADASTSDLRYVAIPPISGGYSSVTRTMDGLLMQRFDGRLHAPQPANYLEDVLDQNQFEHERQEHGNRASEDDRGLNIHTIADHAPCDP